MLDTALFGLVYSCGRYESVITEWILMLVFLFVWLWAWDLWPTWNCDKYPYFNQFHFSAEYSNKLYFLQHINWLISFQIFFLVCGLYLPILLLLIVPFQSMKVGYQLLGLFARWKSWASLIISIHSRMLPSHDFFLRPICLFPAILPIIIMTCKSWYLSIMS